MADNSPVVIERGINSTVYRVADTIHKVVDFKNGSQSIVHELQILTYVDHPNIIKLLRFDAATDFTFVLQLAKDNLTGVKVKGQQLDSIFYQLVRGLAYLHSKDIIHQDIKPSNILYSVRDDNLQIFYSDFGSANLNHNYICQESKKIYTLWYRAPEILLGANHDLSADIWALGCTIAELYTGRPLFNGGDEKSQLVTIFSKLGLPSETDWPGVTSLPYWDNIFTKFFVDTASFWALFDSNIPFQNILKRMLQLNPINRISAEELLRDSYFDSVRDNIQYWLPAPPIKFRPYLELLSDRELLPATIIGMSNNHRSQLFYWVAQYVTRLGIKIASLFLAYRLFQSVTVPDKLSLVACLYIAAELLDGYNNFIDDYIIMSDYELNMPDLIKTIVDTINIVGDKLYQSTSYDFLAAYSSNFSDDIKKLSTFILIVLETDPIASKYDNQLLALSAIYLAVSYYDKSFTFDADIVTIQTIVESVTPKGPELSILCLLYTALDWQMVKNKIFPNGNEP